MYLPRKKPQCGIKKRRDKEKTRIGGLNRKGMGEQSKEGNWGVAAYTKTLFEKQYGIYYYWKLPYIYERVLIIIGVIT